MIKFFLTNNLIVLIGLIGLALAAWSVLRELDRRRGIIALTEFFINDSDLRQRHPELFRQKRQILTAKSFLF